MKFSDGQWLLKDDVTLYAPSEARDIQISDDTMTVFAPYKQIIQRGDTLNAPQFTIKFFSPANDVIGVKLYHFRDMGYGNPEFIINHSKDVNVAIENNEDYAILTSNKLSVKVSKKTWKIDYCYDGKHLTGSSYKDMAYIIRDDRRTYVKEQLSLDVGECVYGLGERFSHFVKNGQVVDIWNKDGGTNSEQSYKNIPFYITNKNYGVFVNHSELVSFEVASEKVESVQFSVPGEYLEYFVIGGSNPKEVLQNYTLLTGKPSLPPAWSFGLWLTTSFTTNYDEKTVNSFIDGMFERDIPLHVFHFDCFWMKEFQWCDFEWDKDVFPDPKGMIQRLKAKGLKICVWINSYIAQKSPLFDEGMEKGYFLKKHNGKVWQWDLWQAGMAIVDFTNPEACDWYKDKLSTLIDIGVDCFKTDFGERIPTDVVYYDGSDPMKMHNYYTYLYNKTVYELLKERLGEDKAVVFARSATVGSQKFPVHWGGDCTATYGSMAESLRGGLSLCLSGFGFWSHDISGFESTATPDIYKRWCAFGLLSTHSRLHGSNSYRVPWLFDEEAVDVLRFFTKLKCSLMPYIFAKACETAATGIPEMRAMLLEFPEDPACDYLDRQYMLGDSLLVAPIFNENGKVSYYLPKGKWTNFINGKVLEGGTWYSETHDYMSIPLMVKENSIIAVGNDDTKPDYDYAKNVTFHVFELQSGKTATAEIHDLSDNLENSITITRNGDVLKVQISNSAKAWSLLLRNAANADCKDAISVVSEAKGVRIVPKDNITRLSIKIK
ncbi:alpha-xylosidase [Clostridium oryzae]|uniref:alpha-D-xyloside xylohydrolase n=1 Tax=Clostridium oryzae TaxID=1450648 RepID=A0A1V4II19_9CLOT|nr:alpha-xylosidase [Clostridium oryzae]OPJ59500.1 alpha-xylosidase [Clostridium oryzae]